MPIIGPIIVFVGGLLLAACGGRSSATNDAAGNGSVSTPADSYSAAPPPPAPPRPSASSALTTMLAAPQPPVDLGAASAEDLARFQGDTDAVKAENWAKYRSVERYFTELRRVILMDPAHPTAPDAAIQSVLRMVLADTRRSVTYSYGNPAQTATITVNNAGSLFLARLINDSPQEFARLMNPSGQPALSPSTLTTLQAAARSMRSDAAAEGGGAEGGASPPPVMPRPARSAAHPHGQAPQQPANGSGDYVF
jgi:hypothetical protein